MVETVGGMVVEGEAFGQAPDGRWEDSGKEKAELIDAKRYQKEKERE